MPYIARESERETPAHDPPTHDLNIKTFSFFSFFFLTFVGKHTKIFNCTRDRTNVTVTECDFDEL